VTPISPPDKTKLLMAMVALEEPSLLAPAALLANLKAVPGLAVDLNSVQTKEDNFVFGLGKDTAAVALVPTPIPWSNLEGPCATAWWWPEAAERMRGHTSHILAALAGDTGNAIQRHIALTHLTAIAAAHTQPAGIYWTAGRVVHDPDVFIEQVQELSADDLPLHLWVDFRLEDNDDGTHRLFTTGMTAFGKPEIEIPGSRKQRNEIYDFAYTVADYVITNPANIESGHTFGRSPEEKVQASYQPSMWDKSMTVLRLEF
jgi:hypothetical protein